MAAIPFCLGLNVLMSHDPSLCISPYIDDHEQVSVCQLQLKQE